MNPVKVSVVIVSYNQIKFTQEAIDSVLSQNVNFKYEIVVGDDASTDGTPDLLKDYTSRYPGIIRLLLQPVNVGPYQNFADTHNACFGEYIAHLDGDDRMLPGKLQKQVDFLDSHPDFSIVSHNLRIFDEHSGETIGLFNSPDQALISTGDDLLRIGTYFGHSSKMYRKSSVPGEGVDGNAGDWLLHLENASFGKIGYINELLGEYRKHAGGITHGQKNKLKQLNIQIYTLNKIKLLNYYKDTLIDYAFSRIYYDYAWDRLMGKDFEAFKHGIVKSYEYKILVSGMHIWLFRFRNIPLVLYYLIKFKMIFYK